MDAYEYRNRAAACARAVKVAHTQSMKNMFRALEREWTARAERAERSALYPQSDTFEATPSDRSARAARRADAIEGA
jgi:hypothetical protein